MKRASMAHERGSGKLITKETVMRRLGIKKTKYYDLLGAGEFGEYVKVGGSHRVYEAELEAYIKRNRVDPSAG